MNSWCILPTSQVVLLVVYTSNADITDYSVGARDKSHEGEASQSSMLCFYNTSPEKSCFVIDLVYFISLCLQVAVSLNVTRRDRNLPMYAL